MYKAELQTKNITPWVNTREFIILHHTWTPPWTINWVLKTLTTWSVSVHYVVDSNWDKYKIWNTTDILWHAWVSEWNWKKDMNKYSIWIEIIWPWFNDIQRQSVKELVQHLMASFNISNEKVLRHADLTNALSFKWILWDWVSPSRKVDVANSFWANQYKTFKDYQNSLVPKKMI